MARTADPTPDPTQTPAEAFLAPLAALARRMPEIEGLVFWSQDGWSDEPTEILESEEIAFYAEGLIPEGFGILWRIVALPGDDSPDHIRLYIAEGGSPPPAETPDWTVLSESIWPAP